MFGPLLGVRSFVVARRCYRRCQLPRKAAEQTVVEHPSLPSATRLLLSLSSVSRFCVLSECKRTIACDVDRPGIRMLGRRSEPEQAGHICYILFLLSVFAQLPQMK